VPTVILTVAEAVQSPPSVTVQVYVVEVVGQAVGVAVVAPVKPVVGVHE
jgi:hypothetical protein